MIENSENMVRSR